MTEERYCVTIQWQSKHLDIRDYFAQSLKPKGYYNNNRCNRWSRQIQSEKSPFENSRYEREKLIVHFSTNITQKYV